MLSTELYERCAPSIWVDESSAESSEIAQVREISVGRQGLEPGDGLSVIAVLAGKSRRSAQGARHGVHSFPRHSDPVQVSRAPIGAPVSSASTSYRAFVAARTYLPSRYGY